MTEQEWIEYHKDVQERIQQREATRFELADKIQLAAYDGDYVYLGDSFISLSELEEIEPETAPSYVWAVYDRGLPPVTLDDWLCNVFDNGWEDMNQFDLNGVGELEEAIKKFNEANKEICVYEVDYSTAILL